MIKAAGIMYVSEGRVLLLKRAGEELWAFPGGKIEDGEIALQAAMRESHEEIGYVPSADISDFDHSASDSVEFTTYLCNVDMFYPALDAEHDGYVWALFDHLPSPLHPGVAVTLGKFMREEKQNALQFPRMFYCKHMQPGTCGYENETILVDTDVLKRMIPSGAGKPVYLDHPGNSIIDRLKNIKSEANGYIAESFYNELDGWAWFKFLVIDEKAHVAATTPGMGVSNGYAALQWGAPGTKNNIPYKRELLAGEFTQLAIVPNPRYEGACIMSPEQFKAYQDDKKRELEELHNSKPKGKPMLKLFKTVKQEVSTVDADTEVELENGKTVTVAEMVNAMKKNADDEDEKKKKDEMENADPEVDCGGEKMKLSELKNKYMKMNEKKNAEDEEAEKKKKMDDEKKNADDEAKKKAEADEEKKNALHFEELKNANAKADATPVTIETSGNKLARGKARYGSK